MTSRLSHIDDAGRARMVDVSDKSATDRQATAEARLRVPPAVLAAIREQRTPKGNVMEVARLAGVMAAKRTAELIPLCHSLPLAHANVEIELGDAELRIVATCRTHAATGVEMEALTAASVAALTLYDMLKALSHEMCIAGVRLLEKRGGKSGDFVAPTAEGPPT